MSAMKILVVCSSWRVFGAEIVTLKQLEGFQRNGHLLQAVTSIWSDGEFSRRLAALGVPEVKVPLGTFSKRLALRPMWWTADALLRLPLLWYRFHRTLQKFQPDVVLYTSSKHAAWLYPWLAGRPSFLIEHNSLAASRSNRFIYQKLAAKLCAFVAVSDFMARHLSLVGAPVEKVRVIKNGVFFAADEQDVKAASEKLPQRSSALPCVGIAGQIAPHKGHDCLLDAVALLVARGLKLQVKVFGACTSDYVKQLQERINREGLADCWSFRGYEPDRSIIYPNMDVCVMPSNLVETFGMAAAEAGAYGVPVVVSEAGGLPEVVEDGVTGWLFDPANPAQLADKLEWLIKNPNHAKVMGTAARERVFNLFTVEKMVGDFEKLFAEFVGRGERSK